MSGKNQKTSAVLIVLLVVCIVALLAAVALMVMLLRNEAQAANRREETIVTQPTQQEVTEATAPAVTQPATDPVAEIQTEPIVQMPTEPTSETQAQTPTEAPQATQPEELANLLAKNNTSFEQLEEYGCTQLVTVLSKGITAKIRFYSCADGLWTEVPQMSCDGMVGRSGVYAQKREGDGCTPSGLYRIGSGFYIDQIPQTGLDLFRITQDTYWVDDPASSFYNKRVEGTENKDWNSAEHMISYDVYRYGFVVDYNVACEPYAGSAIFFHISRSPTAGCIGTREDMVLSYLAKLDKNQNPYILIVSGDDIPGT